MNLVERLRHAYDTWGDDGGKIYLDCLLEIERLQQDAARYRWIREHPAWESECFLNGLTPDEFDVELEKTMRIWNDKPSAP